MAIQTSVQSPLADADDWDAVVDPNMEQEPEPDHVPAPRPHAGSLKQQLIDQIDDINLARYLPQDELDTIGAQVAREFHIDDNSVADWFTKAEKALRFATQEPTPKQFPWPGASSMIFPLIAQAALDFGARTYPAMIQNLNVVKGVVTGSDRGTPVTRDGKPDGPPVTTTGPDGQPQIVWKVRPGEKRQRADRVGEHMSWQLLEEMPDWEPQTDQLLHQIPIIGGAARKTFRDHAGETNCSLFVSLLNLVWDYNATSFEGAPRISEKVLLYPHEITEYERTGDEGEGGMFLPLAYGPGGDVGEGVTYNGKPVSAGGQADDDAPHMFIEQHRRLDLDLDGYSEPYVVTIHLRSQKVVRIVARYDEEGIKTQKDDENVILRVRPVQMYTLYRFLPNLEGGSYPMGFGHLLRSLNEAINTTINQMFDAGTLQNSGGGFVSDQLNAPSGDMRLQVGKFHRVNTKGQDIRAAVFPMPFPGPSTTLFQLLGVLITASKDLAGIGNILTGDAAVANAPPTTVLALIEQGMKFYTAIVKRVFRAEKAELNKLFRLNRLYLDEATEFPLGDEVREITPDDYRLAGGVAPIADPTMTTDMQRLGRAQVVVTAAEKNPQLVNQKEAHQRLFEAAQIDRIDELWATPDAGAAAAVQLEMALKQAQLGAERAKELKDQTQAFLNMALARKNANSQEEAFIESQLNYLRLNIEAINSQTKAAAVAHKFHDTHMRVASDNADRAAEAAQAEREAQQAQQEGDGAEPTPGPTGPFPTPPDAPVGPDVTNASAPGTGNPTVPGSDLAGVGPSGPPAKTIPAA